MPNSAQSNEKIARSITRWLEGLHTKTHEIDTLATALMASPDPARDAEAIGELVRAISQLAYSSSYLAAGLTAHIEEIHG